MNLSNYLPVQLVLLFGKGYARVGRSLFEMFGIETADLFSAFALISFVLSIILFYESLKSWKIAKKRYNRLLEFGIAACVGIFFRVMSLALDR